MLEEGFSRLANPPIREAVIEYRFVHATDPDVDILSPSDDTFSESFPVGEPVFQGMVNLKFSKGGVSPSDAASTLQGFRYVSADRARAAVFTQGSVGYSRFKGYSNRHQFLAEAREVLAKYLSLLPDRGEQSHVSRVGVRFINDIAITDSKSEAVNLDDFFVGLPKPISDDLTTGLRVERQMLAEEREENSLLRLFGPVAEERFGDSVVFVLDVDVWREALALAVESPDLDVLERSLFDKRNQLFFNSLTPEALRRFQ